MKNLAIVYGTYHHELVMQMLKAVRNGAPQKKLKIIREVAVPGSMEKPLAVKRLFLDDKIDAVIVLGIIEKGETKHGFVMGQAVMNALINLQLEFMKPIGVAILGPEIERHQMETRLIPNALYALDTVSLMLDNTQS